MSAADSLINAATGAGGAGIAIAIIQAVFSARSKRADAAKTESETWRDEAKENFERLETLYEKCQKELGTAKTIHDQELTKLRREHGADLSKLRRELGEVKDALSKSLDVIDELLHTPQGLSDAKVREIRASNRAHRAALWGLPTT